MQINNYLKTLIILISVFLWQSCSLKEHIFDQEKFNALGQEALKYALSNDCFTFKSFSSDSTLNFISVCSDLKNFDTDSSLKYFDVQIRNKDRKVLTQFDTIKIDSWSDKHVYMSPWQEIIMGMDFSEILSRKTHNSINSIGIRSYMFSKPELVTSESGYTIIFKISRYFESIIEYVELFIETDKSYDLVNIACHKPKLKEIPHYLKDFPQDRPNSVENIDFYINNNNILIALNDSLLYLFIQGPISSFERYKKVKNNSFISLSPHLCTNDNQEYYETPIEIQIMSDNSIKLISSDTCETRRLSILGNVFKELNLKEPIVHWDSIIIQNNKNPVQRKKILPSDGQIRYDLLTIDQEVGLLTKFNNLLINDHEYSPIFYTLTIYSNGVIIKTSSGNSIPYTLNSIFYKFIN